MVVVADGMGGGQFGEVASNIVITELKNWFENLTQEQKKCYYTGIANLQENLLDEILLNVQSKIQYDTLYSGGTTLVCALVGEKDTMIANIGDSRAYKVLNGKIIQLSREDAIAQSYLENGNFDTKEISRFYNYSNILSQCLGMNNRELNYPSVEIIKNTDYDMILLFTDGVTDCLSDEDIAIVCRTTDKKYLTKKIVEKALMHDSLLPEEYCDDAELTGYIPAGKDNATAAAIISSDDSLER